MLVARSSSRSARAAAPPAASTVSGRADANRAADAGGQLLERRLDDELAAVDDQHLIDGLRDLREHVAGDQHRPLAGGEGAEEVAQPAHALGIEAVGGLVEDQQLGLAEQRRREPEPLPHPERVPLDATVRGAVELDQAAAPRRRASRAARTARLSVRRWSRPERPGWKSVASSTAPTRSAGSSSVGVGRPKTSALPLRRRGESEQHPQRRRLAGAVRAEKAGDRARPRARTTGRRPRGRSEPLRQGLRLDNRRHGYQRRTPSQALG